MRKNLTVIVVCLLLTAGMASGASRWKELAVPQSLSQFAFIDFADSLDGVLFAKSGVFARTADGGKTWKLDSVSVAGEVGNIKYFGKEHYWIQTDSSNYTSFYHSSDGEAWVRRQLPDTLRYSKLVCGFATEQKLIINTGFAIIYSDNAGVTWTNNYSAVGFRHSIDFADSTTGIATFSSIGASGETYRCLTLRTTDGGMTWDTLYAGVTAYDDVHFYTPAIGAMQWNYTSMEAMQFQAGMAFTTDGGKTFRSIQTAATGVADRFFPSRGIEFDASHRLMIASDSRIKSGSDGFYFITRTDPTGIAIATFESVSEKCNWILASGNRLFQSVDIPTEVDTHNSGVSISDLRLDQNYPNPFNPSTTIAFTLPSRSYVSLKIHDALGREVSTLVSEVMARGAYARCWNASGLPSGVYFYRLQAGSYTETKKLLLVR